MLKEWLQYLTSPHCSIARKFGYLKESIAIPARHKRCKEAWQPHLQQSKEAISSAAAQCLHKKTVLILGSGHLLDVPLDYLSQNFKEVILVDIVQPRSVQRMIQSYPNVTLEEWDVTETANILLKPALSNEEILLQNTPQRFLDNADIDFVVSLNLLSQIPIPFSKHLLALNILESRIAIYCQQLVENHLAYIKKFNATYCIISDLKHFTYNRSGKEIDAYDALYGIAMPLPQESWLWHMAPFGELNKNYTYKNHVGCFTNT